MSLHGPIDYAKLGDVLRKQLRLLSSSFIPEMAIKKHGSDELAPYGLNHIYNARITHFDETGNILYTEHDIQLDKYWSKDKLVLPPQKQWLSIQSRVAVHYGYIVAYTKYPDWTGMGYDDYTGFWIGFELGGTERWGIAVWWLRKGGGANRLYAHVGGCGRYYYAAEQTASLPADYTTAKHGYWVKINKHQIWFGIDDRIRVFVLKAPGSSPIKLYNNMKPYTIFVAPVHVPEAQHAIIELGGSKGGKLVGIEIELGYGDVRWSEGDPQPPLALPLYVEASDTVVAGYSVESGSLVTHPVPVYGYEGKTLYFMADKDGTVSIEVLTLAGNWRQYDSVSLSANKLLAYTMAGEALLARIVYTPASYPAKVLEGFAVLR